MDVRNVIMLMAGAAAAFFPGCTETEVPSSGKDEILFYVRNGLSSEVKSIIPDTDCMVSQGLPIVVSDAREDSDFGSAVEIKHYGNGVWRSDKIWDGNKEYDFFAYVKSDGQNGAVATVNKGPISQKEDGTAASLSEPSSYSGNPDDYADFLLSYKNQVNGKDKPLVQLEFERITACVELYMSRPEGSDVTVSEITFGNVCTQADYVIYRHAFSGDQAGNFGMKNDWSVTPETYNNYSRTGVVVPEPLPAGAEYMAEHRVMQFLVPHQSLGGNHPHTLSVKYSAMENGKEVEYNAEFNLEEHSPQIWARGHRIRYYLSMDTTIDLTGTVEDWNETGFIEGTFLPD